MDAKRLLYPRPDCLREDFLDLCGQWSFEYDDLNQGEIEKWYIEKNYSKKINVPYVYQSEKSGINDQVDHEIVWYEKKFKVLDKYHSQQAILNFGAVDYKARIYVNGTLAGEHIGGYSSFDINITNLIVKGENKITVRVEDKRYAPEQVRGKQTWLKGAFRCWYSRHTGIWQPVWIYFVGSNFIKDFKMTPDVDNQRLCLELTTDLVSEKTQLNINIKYGDINIVDIKSSLIKNKINLDIGIAHPHFENGMMLWGVLNPQLYDITFELIENNEIVDTVYSYFGMRKISIQGNKVYINNKFVYQKLILNQGYYPGGFITGTIEDFSNDIEKVLEFGFNGVRIHQKIEDPRFLYLCDKKGLLVWEEMPSAYEYSPEASKHILNEWQEIIKRDYSHPCIVTWVPINESWGIKDVSYKEEQQHFLQAIYHLTKSIDKTRPVIDNDGWEHIKTDICTIHDYEGDSEKLYNHYKEFENVLENGTTMRNPRYLYAKNNYNGEPIMMSEYGGISFEGDSGWGYNEKVSNEDEFIERYRALTMAIKNLPYVTGFCYTQLTDVEIEDNGLLTFERKSKIDPKKIKEINDMNKSKQDFANFDLT